MVIKDVSPDGRYRAPPLWLEIERKLALLGGPACRCIPAHHAPGQWRWTHPRCPEHGRLADLPPDWN
jgi:hypothetical protein